MTRVVISIEFEADDIKALNIADRLFGQFYNQKGFFEGYTMPEYLLPSGTTGFPMLPVVPDVPLLPRSKASSPTRRNVINSTIEGAPGC